MSVIAPQSRHTAIRTGSFEREFDHVWDGQGAVAVALAPELLALNEQACSCFDPPVVVEEAQ